MDIKTRLQKHNIPFDPELVRVAENASINGGAQITVELLNINNPPTAIFLVNDMLAIGAVQSHPGKRFIGSRRYFHRRF